MKAQMSLPANVIGWVVLLAIFVGGMVVLFSFWFGFQTLPKEPVEKATACDFGYMISLWDKATVYPNVFNRTFLQTWDEEETANIFFENMSDSFFLSDSDYFVYVSDGEEVYSLHIPPESELVFETCSQLYMLPAEKKKLENYANLLNALPNGGDITEIDQYGDEEEYRTRLSHYNELYAICPLTAFVADPAANEVSVEAMVTGMTTNLATRLRDGIYRVSVKGEESVSYSLGGYPEGCIVNNGLREVKQKESTNKLRQNPIILGLIAIPQIGSFLTFIIDFIFGVDETADWITTLDVHASCGFNWQWNDTTNVLGVLPVSNQKECKLLTRIPKKIVEEGNLSSKICKPKKVSKIVWWPNGHDIFGKSKKLFYLKVENAKESLGAEKAVEFCETRCEINAPWYVDPKICGNYCVEGIKNEKCTNFHCSFAKSQIHLFDHIPDGAIDIKYVVVEESVMGKRSFDELDESEYYAFESACSTWQGVSNCSTASDCPGQHCVDYGNGADCGSCKGLENIAFCSPNYLENPPAVDDYLYNCQSVQDHLGLSREPVSECLPVILVNRTFQGEEKESIDCSLPEYENAEATWKINASGLCCAEWITKDMDGEEKLVCNKMTEFCPKMKFWVNLDSSNVTVLSEELQQNNFFFEIKQKVCREGMPYNNAPSAFIVASYPADKKDLEYALKFSEIELLPKIEELGSSAKQCENIGRTEKKSFKNKNCHATVQRFGDYIKVWSAGYDEEPCGDLYSRANVQNGNNKLYCSGRCKITYKDGEACIYEETPSIKNSLIIEIGEAIIDCYDSHYTVPTICAKIDVSKLPAGETIAKMDIMKHATLSGIVWKNRWEWKIVNQNNALGIIRADSGNEVCIKYGVDIGVVGVLAGSECAGEVHKPPKKGEPDCKCLGKDIIIFKSGECEMEAKRKSGLVGTKDEISISLIKYKDKLCTNTENIEIGKGGHKYCNGNCLVNNAGNSQQHVNNVCLIDISGGDIPPTCLECDDGCSILPPGEKCGLLAGKCKDSTPYCCKNKHPLVKNKCVEKGYDFGCCGGLVE